MAAQAPDYRIVVAGRDLTPTVEARLISLTLTECRAGEADRLDLTLADDDGKLELPSTGAEITLAIGWLGTGLVDKGTFTVDECEHSGAPDMVTIRARSADLRESLRTRAEHSYHATTVGAVVQAVAERNGLTPRIDTAMAARPVPHIDQTHESDISFITRLAKLNDAVATVKEGKLLFLPITGTTTSNGGAMSPITLTRADGDQHRYHTADRDAYTGVRAYWHDPGRAKRRGVLVGTSENAKRLQDTFANEVDALRAAKAELGRIKRGAANFELTLALGVPELGPQTPLNVRGWKEQIDATPWLTIRATHSISESGFTTRIEAENAAAQFPLAGVVEDEAGSDGGEGSRDAQQ